MRFSIFTSISILTFAFMSNVKASVTPEFSEGIPTTLEDCLNEGGTESVCETLLEAPASCEANHSNDEEAWRDCLAKAEAAYLAAIGKGPAEDEPYVGEDLAVSTEAENSNVDQMDPEHKGFKNADQP
jgi:hypothetical protein